MRCWSQSNSGSLASRRWLRHRHWDHCLCCLSRSLWSPCSVTYWELAIICQLVKQIVMDWYSTNATSWLCCWRKSESWGAKPVFVQVIDLVGWGGRGASCLSWCLFLCLLQLWYSVAVAGFANLASMKIVTKHATVAMGWTPPSLAIPQLTNEWDSYWQHLQSGCFELVKIRQALAESYFRELTHQAEHFKATASAFKWCLSWLEDSKTQMAARFAN